MLEGAFTAFYKKVGNKALVSVFSEDSKFNQSIVVKIWEL